MLDVRITALRKASHPDLMALLENELAAPCCVEEGMQWTSCGGRRPEGFCTEAWKAVGEFVEALARGEENFFDGWMKNPRSALISCNDGFRPVSFLLEAL